MWRGSGPRWPARNGALGGLRAWGWGPAAHHWPRPVLGLWAPVCTDLSPRVWHRANPGKRDGPPSFAYKDQVWSPPGWVTQPYGLLTGRISVVTEGGKTREAQRPRGQLSGQALTSALAGQCRASVQWSRHCAHGAADSMRPLHLFGVLFPQEFKFTLEALENDDEQKTWMSSAIPPLKVTSTNPCFSAF